MADPTGAVGRCGALRELATTKMETGTVQYANNVRCAFFGRNLHSGSAVQLHAFAPLEALPSMRVTNGIPLGCLLILPIVTVNCAQTLKDLALHRVENR
jgi:hypothetical protein